MKFSTNDFLAFCAQFNELSGRKPIDGLFCGHEWKYISYELGVVDYGGVMVYGTHVHWKCKWCGKHRYKIYKKWGFKVYKRNYKIFPKQMEFI